MQKPTDARDKIDLVYRKGPISFDKMMQQTSVYSADELYTALEWAKEEDLVSVREGDLETDGTTHDLWEWEGEK